MNVLVVHNRYREAGGEDRVVHLETSLLERHGHTVVPYNADNRQIGAHASFALAGKTIWNPATYRDVRGVIRQQQIDLVHVHNTLPLISPAVYYAAHAEGKPVVQTLHNYRLLCPKSGCFRADAVCTDCVGKAIAWPAIRHGCYRESRAATATIAAMLFVHRTVGTWHDKVDTYIAPTAFARDLFVSGGFPAEKIVVKPHFVEPDPGVGAGASGSALYVGRLSADKGVETLLASWWRLGRRIPLTIVGDGPMAALVEEATHRLPGVRWLGQQPRAAVQQLIRDAAFLVFPSLGNETFGQVIIEAFAAGTPVVASDRSAAHELVAHRRTGLLTRPGDADDLVAQVEWLLAHPRALESMRSTARAVFETGFTSATNYSSLIAIYGAAAKAAVSRHKTRIGPAEWTVPLEEIGR